MLAHKAMRPRHWEDIAKVTGEQTCLRKALLLLHFGVMGPFDCHAAAPLGGHRQGHW